MRYTYLGDKGTREELRNLQCDPLLDERGKCVKFPNGNQVVVDAEGRQHVVLGRRLRLNSKLAGVPDDAVETG